MKKETYLALIDCNNFFVSCERIFRPDLAKKPVAVLSNNDGCIVARSNEVKSLGVPMGIPYFQVKEKLERENVILFSGNFSLYGDISRRVMNIIETIAENIEIYSIDEAFVELGEREEESLAQARAIKQAVETGTGVPVSIGIAKTKTLAKIAGEYAKKNPERKGVFLLNEEERESFLGKTRIGEIWGMGGRTSVRLSQHGITTARELTSSSDSWIRATLGLGGLRTARELRGERTFSHGTNGKSKKSILSSRSFGKKTKDLKDLEESVAGHITSAARKMRAEGNGTGYVSVFIRSARRQGIRGTTSSGFQVLLSPTTDTFALLDHAFDILKGLYREGVLYEKAGVLLSNFTAASEIPSASLFEELSSKKREGLMSAIDRIEKKYGKNTVFPAAMGIKGKRAWTLKKEFSSPAYTADWNSLPVVRT